MDAIDIINKLSDFFANHESGVVAACADSAIDITDQYQKGQLTLSEYQELIGDIKMKKAIIDEAQHLEVSAKFINYLSDICNAVSIITSL